MSKNISVSDDVYDALSRRKRGRSFSETIREAVEASGQISDVVGQQVLPPDIPSSIQDDISPLGQRTLDRLDGDVADEAS